MGGEKEGGKGKGKERGGAIRRDTALRHTPLCQPYWVTISKNVAQSSLQKKNKGRVMKTRGRKGRKEGEGGEEEKEERDEKERTQRNVAQVFPPQTYSNEYPRPVFLHKGGRRRRRTERQARRRKKGNKEKKGYRSRGIQPIRHNFLKGGFERKDSPRSSHLVTRERRKVEGRNDKEGVKEVARRKGGGKEKSRTQVLGTLPVAAGPRFCYSSTKLTLPPKEGKRK